MQIANEHSFVKLCEALEACRRPQEALHAWANVARRGGRLDGLLGPRAAAALLKTFRTTGVRAGVRVQGG